MSTHPSPWKSAPRGFTLVELLVVIAIIGTLMGLLLPAVQAARERGRQGVCLNNEHEVSLAIIHYESVTGHYPGYLNPLPPSSVSSSSTLTGLNWAMVLLPYLERDDLWGTGTASGWHTGTGSKVLVSQLMCPDDLGWGSGANCAPLSYIVNGTPTQNGVYSPNGQAAFGDRHAGTGVNDFTASQVTAPSQTVMLGEKNSGATPPQQAWWSDAQTGGPSTSASLYLTFLWNKKSGPPSTIFFPGNNANPNHPGLVIVAFFDGHAASLPDTIDLSKTSYLSGP